MITKNLWPLFLAACLPFHGIAEQVSSYLITGTIQSDSARQGFIVLEYTHADGSAVRDTAYIHHNTYRFEGRLKEEAAICANLFWYKTAGPEFAGFAQFYVGPDKVRVLHHADFKTFTVSGSATELDNEALRNIHRAAERHAFIYQHPDSWVSFAILSRMVGNNSADTLAALYAALSPRLRQYPAVAEFGTRVESSLTAVVGTQAPDIAEPDTAGRMLRLEGFRGKYVLVNFWASWCHPCRLEDKFLAPDYTKYKSKGFEILGVSLDGGAPSSRSLWVKAIRDDQTPWAQVSALKAFREDPAALQYGISFIPQNFLVDPNGKIIGKNLDEAGLARALDSVFGGAGVQRGAYTVDGKVPAISQNMYTGPRRRGMMSPGKAFLHRYTLEDGQHTDSATVTGNGTFTFTGTVKAPEIGQLIFLAGEQEQSIVFYLEPGTIHIDCPGDSKHAVVSGTPLNNDLQQFNVMLNRMLDSINATRPGERPYVFWSKEVLGQKLEVVRRFVAAHPASGVGLDQIDQLAIGGANGDELNTLYGELAPALQKTPKGVEVAQRVEGLRSGAIGSVAPAFTLPDTAGRNVSLADFRGKYVLVDFWATWCGPCLEEMPNVIKAHQLYKNQNFVIVGISLDRPDTKALWKKDIVEKKMDWVQISDLKWWNCQAALAYNINGVPANFLIDPSGKIIAKNLRGEALQTKLAEVFK